MRNNYETVVIMSYLKTGNTYTTLTKSKCNSLIIVLIITLNTTFYSADNWLNFTVVNNIFRSVT